MLNTSSAESILNPTFHLYHKLPNTPKPLMLTLDPNLFVCMNNVDMKIGVLIFLHHTATTSLDIHLERL